MLCSLILRTVYFSSSSVVSRAFSALCVYSMFRHHPHPLGYLCVKFRFFGGLHYWALALGENRVFNHSLTQLIWCPGNRSFRFGINALKCMDFNVKFQNLSGHNAPPPIWATAPFISLPSSDPIPPPHSETADFASHRQVQLLLYNTNDVWTVNLIG